MNLPPRRNRRFQLETRKTITLELVLSGDGFSGRAHSDDGLVREFSGRLGLMHTIDELLEPGGTPKGGAEEPPRRP